MGVMASVSAESISPSSRSGARAPSSTAVTASVAAADPIVNASNAAKDDAVIPRASISAISIGVIAMISGRDASTTAAMVSAAGSASTIVVEIEIAVVSVSVENTIAGDPCTPDGMAASLICVGDSEGAAGGGGGGGEKKWLSL